MEVEQKNYKFSKHCCNFALELYKETCIHLENRNSIISPFAVESLLTAIYIGAEGNTANEIKTRLNFHSLSIDDICEQFKTLYKTNFNKTALITANRIYTNRNLKFNSNYLQQIRENFKTEVRCLDYTDPDECCCKINKWIEEKTNRKINYIIGSDVFNSDTFAILINGMYFKGNWEYSFDPCDTKRDQFWIDNTNYTSCNMMMRHGKKPYRYGVFDNLDATGIVMHFGDCNLAMLIILPNKRDGLQELEHKFKNFNASKLVKFMSCKNVLIKLPKFKTTFHAEFSTPLQRLGINSMFGSDASFQNMFDCKDKKPFRFSHVIHKVHIEICEDGVNKNSNLESKECLKSTMSNGVVFHVDHPFMYFIIDEYYQIYFYGKICNPQSLD